MPGHSCFNYDRISLLVIETYSHESKLQQKFYRIPPVNATLLSILNFLENKSRLCGSNTAIIMMMMRSSDVCNIRRVMCNILREVGSNETDVCVRCCFASGH